MLGDILNLASVTGATGLPVGVADKLTGGTGTDKITGASTTPTTTTPANTTPTWTTAYANSNFTNNNLGNNTPDPSMQATLNDPHASILAPPAPMTTVASVNANPGDFGTRAAADTAAGPTPGGAGGYGIDGMSLPGATKSQQRVNASDGGPVGNIGIPTSPNSGLSQSYWGAQYAKTPNRVVGTRTMVV